MNTISPTVAITGIGVVSAFGAGVAALERGLWEGACALRPDAEVARHIPGPPPPVGRVLDPGARALIPAARLRRIPRVAQLCVTAAGEALGGAPGAAVPVLDRYGAERVGVVLGTGLGNLEQTVDFTLGYLRGGPEQASPAAFPLTVMNATAGILAMEWQLKGLNLTVNHRDLSLVEAVATARDQLLLGRADALLAGGVEELGPWSLHGYQRFGALSQAGRARPYDRHRDGVCLGEGAVVVLLERLEDAQARGAAVYGLLSGVGRGGDERPRVGYGRPGEPFAVVGAAQAVQQALAEAGLLAQDLDYVSGGGDGGALDALEPAALRAALGAAAEAVPVSSIIGQVGESMMSAGLRLVAALLALRAQRLPGTVGCEEPSADALPGLCLEARAARVRSALVPVFAQGGGSAALVVAAGSSHQPGAPRPS